MRHVSGDQRQRPYVVLADYGTGRGGRVNRTSWKIAPTPLEVQRAVRKAALYDGAPKLPTDAWWHNLATGEDGPRQRIAPPDHAEFADVEPEGRIP
jgi:hypothetical protein